jgi:diadenosine tetraphosphate (Ap4A) HIT family hydrolase
VKAVRREGAGVRRKNRREAPAAARSALDSVSSASRLTPDASRSCELCTHSGGELLWRDEHCRVVLIDDVDYPGYCRVIWNTHVKEMTDLAADERVRCMHVVFAVERALRDVLGPDKINLASFGNQAPHLHWHVIPRFADDPHFPQSIWGTRQRAAQRAAGAGLGARLNQAIAACL